MSHLLVPGGEGLRTAQLLARDNRYLARVRLDGQELAAHVPNPGRMHELMVVGRNVCIRPAAGLAPRKTAWDLLAVEHDGLWVCIDNRFGGKLAQLALAEGAIDGLPRPARLEKEVTHGRSRLDFRLWVPAPCWVEVKSCTLVEDGHGRFPDAPTARGLRHVQELTALVAAGERAAVLFMVQRPDARSLGPNDGTDPAFGAALRAARAAGVVLLAHTAAWSLAGLQLRAAIPVIT